MGLKALLVAVVVMIALSGLAECAPAAEDDEVQVKGPLDNVLAQARDLAEEYAAKTRELPGIKHTIDMFQKGIDLVGPYARILQDQMLHMWK